MIPRNIIIYLFIAFFTFSSGFVFANDFKTVMEVADEYLRNGQYPEAAGAYQEIAEGSSEPDMRAKAILRIGDIYSYFLNNPDKALNKYEIVKSQYSKSPYAANAYINSGMILYEKDRYHEALEEFKKYIKKYPRGDRRDTAEFMIGTCSKAPTPIKEKKSLFKISPEENIRVLIKADARDIRIDSPSLLEIRNIDENDVLTRVKSAVIEIYNGCMKLNGEEFLREGLVILPQAGSFLSLNGISYRGKIRIQRSPQWELDVINILPVEAYLYGVVPKEMSPQWFPEALKAQAIAARTYALYQMDKSRNRNYDVLATTASQVYGGMGAETENSNRAVDETKGMVLAYKDQPVLAYFHANSGGMTEDPKWVWTTEIPYLKAVRDDYSLKAPNWSWERTLSLDDIQKALNKSGGNFDQLSKIVPLDKSPTGRVMKIRISHGGRETIMGSNDFRLKIDPILIKSTFFELTNNGQEIHFEGKGYGHGVGMSQWGAYVMAREGRSCQEILQYYYHGVDIRKP